LWRRGAHPTTKNPGLRRLKITIKAVQDLYRCKQPRVD
jgi:hypothetical protein